MFEYRFANGSLYLYNGDVLDSGFMDNEIGICYFLDNENDLNSAVLYKHGDKESVQKSFEHARRTSLTWKFEMITFRVKPEMLEDLNKILSTSGWIGIFLSKHKIIGEQHVAFRAGQSAK
jgi:hypothetical protein